MPKKFEFGKSAAQKFLRQPAEPAAPMRKTSGGRGRSTPSAPYNRPMQQIDFHFNVGNRLLYACRVAQTVLRRRMTLAVWSRDERRLRDLDRLMWRYRDLAFLPHVEASRPTAARTPIRWSTRLDALEADVLLLLDDALPDDWEHALSRFGRIIDVVGSAPEEVESSRSRYRAYRAAGAELAAYDQAR